MASKVEDRSCVLFELELSKCCRGGRLRLPLPGLRSLTDSSFDFHPQKEAPLAWFISCNIIRLSVKRQFRHSAEGQLPALLAMSLTGYQFGSASSSSSDDEQKLVSCSERSHTLFVLVVL